MELLVFVSSGCPHCPKAASLAKKVALSHESHGLEYRKVRAKTPEAKELSGKFGISAYPTIVCVDGDENQLFRFVGTPEEGALINKLEKALGIKKSLIRKIFGNKNES